METAGGVSLTVAIVNGSPPRRLIVLHELGLDLAQQEPVRTARVACAGQAFILHDVETELTPRARPGLQRDDVGLAIRIGAAGDDEAVAGPGVGVQTAIEIEIAHHRFLVVDGERRAAERTRGNRVLPRPGQVARLPAPRADRLLSPVPRPPASRTLRRGATVPRRASSRAEPISSRCASVGSASVVPHARAPRSGTSPVSWMSAKNAFIA